MHLLLSHQKHALQRTNSTIMDADAVSFQDRPIQRWVRKTIETWKRRKMIAAFAAMDDRLLDDIGVQRADIAQFVDGLNHRELGMAPVAPHVIEEWQNQSPLRLAA